MNPTSTDRPSDGARPNPLEGLVVLDMGQIYQGPYCGFLLAMAGATVIKVEPPAGDPVRFRRTSALPLAMLNSNKLGVSVDLKTEEGREKFLALVSRADVLLENFAPGALERLGMGAQTLLSHNPRLIYASATGYGSWGPDRDRLSLDLTVQATVGAMSITGFPDRPPTKAGPAIADFLGGTHLYAAIVTALHERHTTGVGRIVEVAMQDAMFPAMASSLQLYFENPSLEPRVGNRHGGLAVCPYNTYTASDGYITIMCVTDKHWRALCTAMEREDLAQAPGWATHDERCRQMERTDSLIDAWSSHKTRKELSDLGLQHRYPCASVRTLGEVVHDPHMHQRGMLHYVMHPELGEVVLPHSPLRFHGTEPAELRPHPTLGQHNEDIFSLLDALQGHRTSGNSGR